MNIPQIYITHKAWGEIKRIARKSKELETGGILLGKVCKYENGRAIIVTEAKGPGEKAQLGRECFVPDINYYQKILQRNQHLIYVGEWHKHPSEYPFYSQQDLKQALEICESENIQELLCPICYFEKQGNQTKFTLQFFYINKELKTFLPITYRLVSDVEDRRQALRYLAIERKVIQSFLSSRRHHKLVDMDIYRSSKIAHIYKYPLRKNAKAMFVNAHRCSEFFIPDDVEVVVSIASKRGKEKSVRAYQILPDDPILKSIETQVVSLRPDVLQRNRSLLETSKLKGKHVAVIGLGSVGAQACIDMARAGVGNFTLIDSDIISIENLCRHVCDLSELGMPKVEAIRKRIHRILPETKIETHFWNTNENPDRTREISRKADVILISTDTENSRRLFNWIAHSEEIPIIYAGLLERAIGGRVWRVIPKKTACYECYPGEKIVNRGPVAYSQVQSSADLNIQPGLGNDIAFITHLAVRYTIDTLTHRPLPWNMIFWFNQYHENWNTEPLTLYKVESLPRNAECPFCKSFGGGKENV